MLPTTSSLWVMAGNCSSLPTKSPPLSAILSSLSLPLGYVSTFPSDITNGRTTVLPNLLSPLLVNRSQMVSSHLALLTKASGRDSSLLAPLALRALRRRLLHQEAQTQAPAPDTKRNVLLHSPRSSSPSPTLQHRCGSTAHKPSIAKLVWLWV
jgi:hypothetical protein